MNPVLFLDFDGPLFPENLIPHSKPISEYPGKIELHKFITYWEMSVTSVRQLNALYDIFPFDTIVSSSWKHFCDRDQIEELFRVNELKLHLHPTVWKTPEKMSSYRINEICWALDKLVEVDDDADAYVAPSHIILDDPWSGSYLESWKSHGLQEPIIVDPNVGISHEEWRCMRGIVQSWADDYKSRSYHRVKPTFKPVISTWTPPNNPSPTSIW